jgi:osmoprotectant transport system substrate-binding protein
MSKRFVTALAVLCSLIMAAAALSGCAENTGSGTPAGSPAASSETEAGGSDNSQKTITVGSKGFAENQIVAKCIQFALEEKGYKVEFIDKLDGEVLQKAIETGTIDLYPEYTNTGIVSILKLDPIFDTDEAYRVAKEKYKEKYNIVWLEPSNINDTYCLVLSKKASEKYGIKTISELQAKAENIRAAQASSWEDRPDHLPALEAKYGKFNFKDKKIYDGGLKYQVLLNDQGDLTLGYTTDPQLEDGNLVTLQDDKQVWPPYYLVPIIKQEALDKYPEVEAIINGITKHLDTETIIKLSADVVIRHEEFTDVAEKYYKEQLAGK